LGCLRLLGPRRRRDNGQRSHERIVWLPFGNKSNRSRLKEGQFNDWELSLNNKLNY
jgi:hypothetical protein